MNKGTTTTLADYEHDCQTFLTAKAELHRVKTDAAWIRYHGAKRRMERSRQQLKTAGLLISAT